MKSRFDTSCGGFDFTTEKMIRGKSTSPETGVASFCGGGDTVSRGVCDDDGGLLESGRGGGTCLGELGEDEMSVSETLDVSGSGSRIIGTVDGEEVEEGACSGLGGGVGGTPVEGVVRGVSRGNGLSTVVEVLLGNASLAGREALCASFSSSDMRCTGGSLDKPSG